MARTSKNPAMPAPGAGYQPAAVLKVTTAEQLKAISDPLRMQLLECISKEALTVKQMAARLEQPPTRLYYHVGALEEAGFVVVVDTRIKSGIVEKFYRISAENIQVDRNLLKQSGVKGDEALQSILSAVFDSTIADLQQSFAAGQLNLGDTAKDSAKDLVLAHQAYHLRPGDVPRFIEKINDLLKELGAAEDEANGVGYACTVAFYPRLQDKSRKPPKRSV